MSLCGTEWRERGYAAMDSSRRPLNELFNTPGPTLHSTGSQMNSRIFYFLIPHLWPDICLAAFLLSASKTSMIPPFFGALISDLNSSQAAEVYIAPPPDNFMRVEIAKDLLHQAVPSIWCAGGFCYPYCEK
jgi:hypothetical protein